MSKYKLLLADDSVTIQKVVNLTFADEGIEVTAVGDGDLALQSIADSTPDIVLADVHMPGVDGYRICESIRANEVTKDVPVILLVGSFEPFDEGESNRVGANAYLTKPFHSIRELVTTVTELLNSREPIETGAVDIESEQRPLNPPDTSDIDSLYQNSFADTAEIPTTESIERPEFADAGMDDEIIQTSYADSEYQAPEATGTDDAADGGEIESVDENGPAHERIETEDPFATGPLATDETMRNFNVDEGTPDAGETGIQDYTNREDSASAPDSGWSFQSFESGIESEAQPPDNAGQEAGESTSRFSIIDTLPPERSSKHSSPVKFHFEDADILELPSLADGKAYNFTTAAAASDSSNQAQVVSLSPELVEAIVQKVVERLAERQ